MDAADIKGLAVVGIAHGAKLGYVQDILFDTGNRRIAALQIANRGQQALIPFDQVASVGRDAITVPSADVVSGAGDQSPLGHFPGLEQLLHLKVVDDAGTYQGTVYGLQVDPSSGQITAITFHKGGLMGIGGVIRTVSIDAVRGIGPEVLVMATGMPT